MKLVTKGFGNKTYFFDEDTKKEYGSYCPACGEKLRTPSIRWHTGLYRHLQTQKHKKNEEEYNMEIQKV
jgi:hypothetical protein